MHYNDMQIENAAQAAHEVNRAYCREVMYDLSHLPWKYTPDNIRDSVRSGVRAIIERPNLSPAESHQRWIDYKTTKGWTYGTTKSFSRKTHPCMVPFSELPVQHQVKDTIFGAVVRAALGIRVAP
jgi:hypothetical protein